LWARCSPTGRLGNSLCPRDIGLTLEAVLHLVAVRGGRQPMPPRAKVLGDGALRRQKPLGMSRRLQPLHAICALACRTMRVLTAVMQIATLAVFHSGQDLALRRAIALQLVCNDDPRHVLQFLEERAKEFLG